MQEAARQREIEIELQAREQRPAPTQSQPAPKRFKAVAYRSRVIKGALVQSELRCMTALLDQEVGATNVARRGILRGIVVRSP